MIKKLFIDIETAPNLVYTWGLFNQNVSLDQIVESGRTLCFAAKWDDSEDIEFYSEYFDSEEIMVRKAWDLLDQADIVIHYNGKKFDIPILNKEFIRLGLEPPTPYQQVDLLETARKRFRFTSNKLDYVSQFLGLESKLQHKGMRLWTECMNGDVNAWLQMQEYNEQDVRLLPKLYKTLLPWDQHHPNMGLYTDEEAMCCTNCGSPRIKKNGIEHLKTQSYQRYKCLECGTPLKGRFTILPIEKRKVILTQSKI